MMALEFEYEYAGQALRSGFPLPELTSAAASHPSGFRLKLARNAPTAAEVRWSHAYPDAHGRATLTCERTSTDLRLDFPHVATVVANGNDVCIHPHTGASIDSVRHVVLDQALPRLLAQRGELVLHAAAVRTLASRTLLLIGDSGRGKSTLTGAFYSNGRSVATDDGALVRVIDGVLIAFPTYPSLRLLPDSRDRLFAGVDAAALPVAGYGDKRRLPVANTFGAARVDGIVMLAPPLEDGTPPSLTRETPGNACMAMVRNGFQLDLSDAGNLQVLLGKAAEAARLVPVYRLGYPRRYDALPDVLALLEALG